MSLEDRFDQFIEEYRRDREAEKQERVRDRHETLGWTAFGLALAVFSFAGASTELRDTLVYGIGGIVLAVGGWVELGRARAGRHGMKGKGGS